MKTLLALLRLLNMFSSLSRGTYVRNSGRRAWRRLGRKIIK